jgi:hypothetical protein
LGVGGEAAERRKATNENMKHKVTELYLQSGHNDTPRLS